MRGNVVRLEHHRDIAESDDDDVAGNEHEPGQSVEMARSLSRQFSEASAANILNAAIHDLFPDRIALVSSFGAEAAPLLHLVAEVNPDTPVIFLETGKHFAQTLSHRRKLASRLGLKNVIDVRPSPAVLEKSDPAGDLWRHDPDACCTIRKVHPLASELKGYEAWITGRKQFHGGERIKLPVFDFSAPHIKVNPLVKWTQADVADYVTAHDLPPHPLVAQGYPSIGCWPCTHPVADGADQRAGRWRGQAKTECGIHQMRD